MGRGGAVKGEWRYFGSPWISRLSRRWLGKFDGGHTYVKVLAERRSGSGYQLLVELNDVKYTIPASAARYASM